MSPEQRKAIIAAIAKGDVNLLEKTKSDIDRNAVVFTTSDSFLMALYKHSMSANPDAKFPSYVLNLNMVEKAKLDKFLGRYANRKSVARQL